MFIKTKCPVCGEDTFNHIKLHRRSVFLGEQKVSWITAAEITDTCSPEELAVSVMHELRGHVYNGVTTHELCRVLRDKFGVLEQYCCDIVQKLKIELNMYCPDRRHLYYV
ncbi:hypothetical protein [Methanolobus sp. WCC5]|uniref:hypothetical protein n=1 Tax=Methanolobus sp. WCC5 TaxID=3125785 RepID=UPI0032505A34